MGLEHVPRCQHVKMNGTQCGSPALRRRRFCFFHRRVEDQRARIAADHFAQRPFEVPVLEDANSVQMALMQVMQMLAMRTIEHKTAGLMLYALQTASVNVRKTDFEVEEATDVVIDRDTVHLTSIGGPQWFEEDFEGEEEEGDEEDGEEAGEEGVDEEAVDDDDEAAQKEDDADVPAPVVKVSQSAPGPAKLPAARAGETAVESLKRILAATEKRPLSG